MNPFDELAKKFELSISPVTARFKSPTVTKKRTAKEAMQQIKDLHDMSEEDMPSKIVKKFRDEIISPKTEGMFEADSYMRQLNYKIPESLYPTIDARFKVCEQCKFLSAEGCKDCHTCGAKKGEWHKRIINGTCKAFAKFPDAKYLPDGIPTISIRRKVNDMFVYLYNIVFSTPDDPAQNKNMNIVAQDIKSVLKTLEDVSPGANLIGAPVGIAIDAIADGIIADNLEKHNTSTLPMFPTPVGPMPADQILKKQGVI
jgi:hypothetical protein